jgi:hypothetical protein
LALGPLVGNPRGKRSRRRNSLANRNSRAAAKVFAPRVFRAFVGMRGLFL